MTVVADAGPLIALGKIGRLELLSSLESRVVLPPAVYQEVIVMGRRQGRLDALAVQRAIESDVITRWREPVALSDAVERLPLGLGEREAIQCALELEASRLLADDLAARDAAKRLGVAVVGTLGVVVQAYRSRTINLSDVRQIGEQIRQRDDIWIHPSLVDGVVRHLEKTRHESDDGQ